MRFDFFTVTLGVVVVAICVLVMIGFGGLRRDRDAYAYCLERGYPELKLVGGTFNRKHYCHRRAANGEDQLLEVPAVSGS